MKSEQEIWWRVGNESVDIIENMDCALFDKVQEISECDEYDFMLEQAWAISRGLA